MFFKVIYDEKRQKEIFEKAIKDFLAEDEKSLTDELVTNYSFDLICGLAFFKNEKFKEEEEWRFFYLNIPLPDIYEDIHFRYKEKYLHPYIKFKFSSLFSNGAFPFREIVVGPSRDELAMMSVKEFIDTHYPMSLDNKEIEINPSAIPLRSI